MWRRKKIWCRWNVQSSVEKLMLMAIRLLRAWSLRPRPNSNAEHKQEHTLYVISTIPQRTWWKQGQDSVHEGSLGLGLAFLQKEIKFLELCEHTVEVLKDAFLGWEKSDTAMKTEKKWRRNKRRVHSIKHRTLKPPWKRTQEIKVAILQDMLVYFSSINITVTRTFSCMISTPISESLMLLQFVFCCSF